MKISWANDTHFDHATEEAFQGWCDLLGQENPDVLLLAGDIDNGHGVAMRIARIRNQTGIPVIFALGNHDLFGRFRDEVRAEIRDLTRADPGVLYISDQGVVALTTKTAIIGHDGWADGRSGNVLGTPVRVRDDEVIEDLARVKSMFTRLEIKRQWADESALAVGGRLEEALRTYDTTIVLTHASIAAAASFNGGQRGDWDWQPHMVNTVLGEKIVAVMASARPEQSVIVLTGHSHGACDMELAPGVRVLAGEAEYGKPALNPSLEVPGLKRFSGRARAARSI